MQFINLKDVFVKARKQMDDFIVDEIPYVTALTLTRIAQEVKQKLTDDMDKTFTSKGKPTPFTKHAIGLRMATKQRLASAIFVKPLQASYLSLEQTGGERKGGKTKNVMVPVNITRNQYGNVPRGTIRRLAGKKDYFVGEIKGTFGLWQRTGKNTVKLIVRYEKETHIEAKWDYFGKAEKFASACAEKIWQECMRQVMGKKKTK